MQESFIHEHIKRLCKIPRTFEFISQNLMGHDLVQTKIILDKLISKKILIKDESNYYSLKENDDSSLDLYKQNPDLYLKKYMGHFDFLQTPHPLDYEWRNTTSTLKYLVGLISKYNEINDSVLLLGMPTLFASACQMDIPQMVSLIESNTPIVESLKKYHNYKFNLFEKNIFEIDPNHFKRYYSVFMDPPWYYDHFINFIWFATQVVDLGGLIFISLPPLNTRPELDKERMKLLNFCSELGLCLEELYAQKLEYAMPFFEYNAMRAAGVSNLYPFWRKGDLAIFRKLHSTIIKRPETVKTKVDIWKEIDIDGVRLRFKFAKKQEPSSQTKIQHLVEGDILPTVSSRHPIRKEANMWTSGNRIFQVSNSLKLYTDINNILLKNYEAETINDSLKFIKFLVDLERKEFSNYLDWIYYEMERKTY
ncbi:hypothetical protein [Maribellus maritimus]|uniref:hypothetical protein n=1 Tax=Maribellus maritimus TaxID=2870838 RepID=UPI001EEA8092|nr:hypothetical protein [Maribellus maritimus]MCG6190202.1 hypothetical protein [Maribellus maritimus]